MSLLFEIVQQLEARRRPLNAPYVVPGLWVDGVSTPAVSVDPFEFYAKRLTEIASSAPKKLCQGSGGGEWTRNAIIYNLFPRVTTAFDHNQDGRLEIGPIVDGWRETGTLLKCIALLPFIREMGFNTVHLLPICSVGQDGKKGNLGSPYAVRNQYQLDENLNEPILDLTIDHLFAAFVEAAHHLGLRVVLEFVLRTGAKDSDWIPEHPDWFYWIRADVPDRSRGTGRLTAYGNPIFPHDTLGLLKAKVAALDFKDLPPPPDVYRTLFSQAPRPDQIVFENGRYIGTLDDGTRVRVPGAFADWPPDDNQPPWTDVTYLRMYSHPDFNYMAYNTIRMYDERLTAADYQNRPLWDAIAGVIPHYQRNFGIDGVMIDMGHALPFSLKQRIIATARNINPDFAFWDENFSISQHSRDQDYNAVMGYWVLGAHQGESMRNLVNQMAHTPFPISFFAAPENHNTPRAAARHGGTVYSHYALALAVTTPGLPFILSGFELAETHPMNTGLGFTNEQLALYAPDRLPLFSVWGFNWTRPDNLVASVKYALDLRKKYESVFCDASPESFILGYCDNPRILVFSRKRRDQWISVIANTDQYQTQWGRAVINARLFRVPGLWGTADQGMDLHQELTTNVSLVPGYVLIIEGSQLPH
jgi:starch synthase (maltosyl-transferring)